MTQAQAALIGAQFAPVAAGDRTATWSISFVGNVPARPIPFRERQPAQALAPPTTAPTGSANAPSNAGAGALGWLNLLGLLSLLGLGRRR